ncbi:SAM-dependent methyltransferase [Kitasatospora sp. NPDC002551]|uniref:SAM-dependent methyltransferase n=1 Tax=Kitasatospora sp. NPDC002551 TaxID=3154539 RepID=UPI00331D6580
MTRLTHRYTGPAALAAFLDQVLADAAGRPILADFYCCQGGATRGYQDYFYVLGIDLDDQPRYCGQAFIQGDALTVLAATADWLRTHAAAVHGSPPCQGYSDAQVLQGNDHPMLIAPTCDAFTGLGLPWVIENVPGARGYMTEPIVLCGAMFGHRTYRDRLIEAGGGLTLPQPHHPRHELPITKMGRPRREGEMAHYVGNFPGVQEARDDLGVPWMNRDGIRESIPPSYARWIGQQLTRHLAALPAPAGAAA